MDPTFMSLWISTAGAIGYPPLEEDLEVDVAVVGGGIAGLTAALELKRRGLTVAVIEASRIGSGVTGSTTGKVTSLHRLAYTKLAADHGEDAARAYGRANEAAIAHIARTVEAEGIECSFRRVANFTYAEAAEHLAAVRAEAELAARLGLPSAFTTDVPLPFPVAGAVRFDAQAQFHAVKYLHGLARAVAGGGSVVVEHTEVRDLRDGSPAVAVTDRGVVRAREIVVATNVPIADAGRYSERLTVHRSYIVASPLRGAELSEEATFISADEPMRSLLTTRQEGVDYVLVGGEGHPVAEGAAGPGAGARVGSAERYRRLEAFSRTRLSSGPAAYRWSTQDTLPADGLPFAGPLTPDSRHLYVITGLRKWGLTNGTAAALCVSDAITGSASPWAQLFDSTRPTPRGGAAASGGGGSTTGEAPLPPWTGRPRLAPREGAVFDVGGKATAVYADEDGGLHALSARCTHLRCVVEFARGVGSSAPTWDCPCHGSRFALDGTVIQGPAEKDLSRRPLPGD